MEPNRRKCAVAAGLLLAVVAGTVPAQAAGTGGHAPAGQGQKQRIMRLVHDYFVARDKGWLLTEDTAATRLGDGEMADGPRRLAAHTSRIAAEVEAESGLRVEEVSTGTSRKPKVDIRGRRAKVTVTSASTLKWSNKELGESVYSDPYVVELERPKKSKNWRIVKVRYATVPLTDADEEVSGLATGPRQRTGVADQPVGTLDTKTFDRPAAGEYARYWSGQSVYQQSDGTYYIEDRYNSTYDRAKQDNNCTNFVSQVLHSGGWELADGVDPGDEENWHYDLWGPAGPSRSWSVAYELWKYTIDSGRATRLQDGPPGEADLWNLKPGDPLFVDWWNENLEDDPATWKDERAVPDGKIDHAMAISGSYTELGFTEPTYSQNSPHRSNIPLSVGIKIATAPMVDPDGDGRPNDWPAGREMKVHFYPVHVNDTFETD
ncbi:amidase domain-containing protein [Streptomyces sp. NPDC050803]|uniref:amidase domain-containing protein n=1 Tax=unclassified Streptomyces TaxID=2593676 RepID=UPI00343A4CD9